MKFYLETERLIMREIRVEDAEGMFALDSDPEVTKFLNMKPLTDIQQSRDVIAFIQKKYTDYGIGRWAVVKKDTNEFIGWSGLTVMTKEVNGHIDFIDVGYRFIRKYWGHGYATETALASLRYGFETMKLNEIYGHAIKEHVNSRKVLEKIGLKFVNEFDGGDFTGAWYKITKEEYLK